jgi:hypothetical protein
MAVPNARDDAWYISGGVYISAYVVSDCIFTPLAHVLRPFYRLTQLFHRFTAKNQTDLDLSYDPPRMKLWVSFRHWLTSMVVFPFYSTPCPLIWPATLVKVLLLYVVERYLLFNVYMAPPAIDHRMPQHARKFLPVGLVLKLSMMFLVYGDAHNLSLESLRPLCNNILFSKADCDLTGSCCSETSLTAIGAFILCLSLAILLYIGEIVMGMCLSQYDAGEADQANQKGPGLRCIDTVYDSYADKLANRTQLSLANIKRLDEFRSSKKRSRKEASDASNVKITNLKELMNHREAELKQQRITKSQPASDQKIPESRTAKRDRVRSIAQLEAKLQQQEPARIEAENFHMKEEVALFTKNTLVSEDNDPKWQEKFDYALGEFYYYSPVLRIKWDARDPPAEFTALPAAVKTNLVNQIESRTTSITQSLDFQPIKLGSVLLTAEIPLQSSAFVPPSSADLRLAASSIYKEPEVMTQVVSDHNERFCL